MIVFTVNLNECLLGRFRLRELPEAKIGWLFPKNSILRTLFNRFMMKHRENGVIQKLQAHHLKSVVNC